MLHRPLLSVLLACGAWLGGIPHAVRAQGEPTPPSASGPVSPLLQSLEAALNAPGEGPLEALLQPAPGFDPAEVTARRQALRSRFPDARWRVTPGPALADGRGTVQIHVTGSRKQTPFSFALEADQQLALAWTGGRINGQEILREQSLVRSTNGDLAVSLQVPDAVLTGQRYDIDLIVDQPLQGAITAGGLIALTPQQVKTFETPILPMGPIYGGGLFKTVQAPASPGAQTWALVLVHPRGIVSVSKRVRVVADRSQLTP